VDNSIAAETTNRSRTMNKSTNNEIITFYDIPLACDAAPAIGCGSLAKPFLIDLERQVAIEEAWLNRAGTIVAIVWSGSVYAPEIAKPIFEKHEVRHQERPGDPLASFREDGSWFRGAEVDLLSFEEAREIAETSVSAAKRERLVSVEEAAQIESDIEAYFREELVKLRTKQELLRDAHGKFRQAVLDFFKKHIGVERTAELVRADGVEDAFSRVGRDEALSCCA
jgi:hypothetical protein